jgi:nitrogenase molybdenum-iron protein NifN
VEAIIRELVPPGDEPKRLRQVNLLAGSHLSPGDIEALKDLVTDFGLTPIVLPDLSRSLDGYVPRDHVPTTLGGTAVEEIRRMSQSVLTLALGDHMRASAELLQERADVPFHVFDRLTGLEAVDGFVAELMTVSGASAPLRLRRQRSRLVDAMLDGHGYFAGRAVAIGAEPDLLFALSSFVADLGASVVAAVSSTNSPMLAGIPTEKVTIGDLDDLEHAMAALPDVDLILSNAHAQGIARLFDVPLFRAGFPVFDRLGAAQRVTVGYDGTRDLLFQLANTFIERASTHAHAPGIGGHAHLRWT